VWVPGCMSSLDGTTPERAQVQDEGFAWCLFCNDELCREWAVLERPDHVVLPRVSECEMFDTPEETRVKRRLVG
jgi:hypothetical protein